MTKSSNLFDVANDVRNCMMVGGFVMPELADLNTVDPQEWPYVTRFTVHDTICPDDIHSYDDIQSMLRTFWHNTRNIEMGWQRDTDNTSIVFALKTENDLASFRHVVKDLMPNWPYSEEYLNEINNDMCRSVLDEIKNGLTELGIPRGTYGDDQVWNLVSLYNRRGDLLAATEQELQIRRRMYHDQEDVIKNLEKAVATLEDTLVEIANWPNRDSIEEIKTIKLVAGSTVNPGRVIALKSLTE